ncbi:helix-turn-helix transcriptional regulator [Bacillus mycoides]|uniref:helix-turn-helix transcriptional regulator n=1 Tax=Bacillus mycoides TaxID=1405 RepID=UPI001642B5C2|nr:helix-turn-helix transcriptional regulator [Bacillus mycoides]
MIIRKRRYPIKELRCRFGFSQAYVAGFVGVSRDHYSLIENNKRSIASVRTGVVFKLAELFEIKVDEFFLIANIAQCDKKN